MVPHDARAFWLAAPGLGEIRPGLVADPRPGEVLVRTLFSGISRGTETRVFRGGVSAGEYAAMRAPFQEGDLPAPVKYGYLNVGRVLAGDEELQGRTVFCLYPHQSLYVVPTAAVVPVPLTVPAQRAVLAGTVETAVNALWDGAPMVGDRIGVVGAGMLGCTVARLLTRIPGVRVSLYDVDDSRAAVADRLGVGFELSTDPLDTDRITADPSRRCDLVFHASASAPGLRLALELLADEGRVVELSWYGDTSVDVRLGGRFHSGRLGIVASQVGTVATARRGRYSTRDRLALALDLLKDPAFDTLLTGTSPLDDLPSVLPRLADGTLSALCHTISYPEGG